MFEAGGWTDEERNHRSRVHPPGNLDRYQNKGVAGKAIRKNMKTKGEQNSVCHRGTETLRRKLEQW